MTHNTNITTKSCDRSIARTWDIRTWSFWLGVANHVIKRTQLAQDERKGVRYTQTLSEQKIALYRANMN